MSILLDALKRSESQRELGTVPTLQTSIEPSRSGEPGDYPWVAVVLVLLAIGIMSWMGLEQYRAPEDMLAGNAGAPEAAENQPAPESDPEVTLNAEPGTSSGNLLPRVSGPVAGNQTQTQSSTSQGNPADEPPQAAQPRVGRDLRDYVATDSEATARSEPVQDVATQQRQVAGIELEGRKPVEFSTDPSRQSPDQTVSGSAASPYEPDIISYWQVPEATREGLPDLKISVLVYAEQAENRFLLLNGERMREGDSLENGLRLEEIRRDRAIFMYRDYRFYLKS